MRNCICRVALLIVLTLSAQTAWGQVGDPGSGGGGQALRSPSTTDSPTLTKPWRSFLAIPLGIWTPTINYYPMGWQLASFAARTETKAVVRRSLWAY